MTVRPSRAQLTSSRRSSQATPATTSARRACTRHAAAEQKAYYCTRPHTQPTQLNLGVRAARNACAGFAASLCARGGGPPHRRGHQRERRQGERAAHSRRPRHVLLPSSQCRPPCREQLQMGEISMMYAAPSVSLRLPNIHLARHDACELVQPSHMTLVALCLRRPEGLV